METPKHVPGIYVVIRYDDKIQLEEYDFSCGDGMWWEIGSEVWCGDPDAIVAGPITIEQIAAAPKLADALKRLVSAVNTNAGEDVMAQEIAFSLTALRTAGIEVKP